MKLPKLIVISVLLLTGFGFAGGMLVASRFSADAPTTAVADQAPAAMPSAAPPRQGVPLAAASTMPDLSSVAEAALKAAANISSTTTVTRRSPWPFWFDDQPQSEQSQSLGSGVVVSSDGLILTNTHVIGNNGSVPDIRVTLSDGRERPGRIVGIDDLSDLAVVKVDAKNLPTLPWGDSGKLRVAEWVLAIGNPFQLSGTVTLGIVSTVSRSQSGAFTDFIQTDAAINPGNSGGALVNARGELVGINSMIYSETGGYQGIGFAIPSNSARMLMEELVAHGSVSWGSIGFVDLLDASTARRYGFGELPGPIVTRINTGSAAYRGGLRLNDIIVAFAGQPVTDASQLSILVARAKAGSQVKMDVQRDGRRVSLNVLVESREAQQTQQPRRAR